MSRHTRAHTAAAVQAEMTKALGRDNQISAPVRSPPKPSAKGGKSPTTADKAGKRGKGRNVNAATQKETEAQVATAVTQEAQCDPASNDLSGLTTAEMLAQFAALKAQVEETNAKVAAQAVELANQKVELADKNAQLATMEEEKHKAAEEEQLAKDKKKSDAEEKANKHREKIAYERDAAVKGRITKGLDKEKAYKPLFDLHAKLRKVNCENKTLVEKGQMTKPQMKAAEQAVLDDIQLEKFFLLSSCWFPPFFKLSTAEKPLKQHVDSFYNSAVDESKVLEAFFEADKDKVPTTVLKDISRHILCLADVLKGSFSVKRDLLIKQSEIASSTKNGKYASNNARQAVAASIREYMTACENAERLKIGMDFSSTNMDRPSSSAYKGVALKWHPDLCPLGAVTPDIYKWVMMAIKEDPATRNATIRLFGAGFAAKDRVGPLATLFHHLFHPKLGVVCRKLQEESTSDLIRERATVEKLEASYEKFMEFADSMELDKAGIVCKMKTTDKYDLIAACLICGSKTCTETMDLKRLVKLLTATFQQMQVPYLVADLEYNFHCLGKDVDPHKSSAGRTLASTDGSSARQKTQHRVDELLTNLEKGETTEELLAKCTKIPRSKEQRMNVINCIRTKFVENPEMDKSVQAQWAGIIAEIELQIADRIETDSANRAKRARLKREQNAMLSAPTMQTVSAQPAPVVSAQPVQVVSAQPAPVVSAQPVQVVSAQPVAQPMQVDFAQSVPQPVPQPMQVDFAQSVAQSVAQSAPVATSNGPPTPGRDDEDSRKGEDSDDDSLDALLLGLHGGQSGGEPIDDESD